MADELKLQNYSDDSKIKQWIQYKLAPMVFKNIPLNDLNVGSLSLFTEYMSQGMEQMAFTSSFYFNESFITKAILADSIYAEAAIFNIGYSYAIPSSCNFLLELKIEDIYKNAVLNVDNGLYEFILDKDTKFNLSNGSVYSLDYDILIQYKNVDTTKLTSSIRAWNVQYTNKDQLNSIAKNKDKDTYIVYRVTDTWLCLFVQASEYERQKYTVVNNMTNGIPNQDTVISCLNHICGFDIKYIDGKGNEQWIPHDHILPINDSVKDADPYVHYIMDNPQTIRFIWQLNGSKYFVPKVNSSYEITIYTCHGEAANFSAFNNEEQPQVITTSNRFSNNGNVMKAAFVVSGSLGGTNIGTIETVRRETIEAYNTANQLATDHDLDEWFKTFYFKNVLYPFFYKRRDDPWGRIWSGYIALKDSDDYVYRTNTLHGKIDYETLYSNNDNTVNNNEIIIPPAWVWVYGENKHTVVPYKMNGKTIVEKANTSAPIGEDFVFANPFGIRIQKEPFAIGYFNPWINESVTCSLIPRTEMNKSPNDSYDDTSIVYHATPIFMNISRTYQENYYKIVTYISPSISVWGQDAQPLVQNVQQNAVAPLFPANMWTYFNKPLDDFASDIPMLPLNDSNDEYLAFDPYNTYFCVKNKTRSTDGETWDLNGVFWILDQSESEEKQFMLPITIVSGTKVRYYGDDSIWGNSGKWYGVPVTGDTTIRYYSHRDTTIQFDDHINFERVNSQNYYEMRLDNDFGNDQNAGVGWIQAIRVEKATKSNLTKYGEDSLYLIGDSMSQKIFINIKFRGEDNFTQYEIQNAASVYIPWDENIQPQTDENGNTYYEFDFHNVGASGIILYADMKPEPSQGAIDYYRIRFSDVLDGDALFHIENDFLNIRENNMRVILHAMMNGGETGRIEMRPVSRESDGSYRFESEMYPLNELVDIDNRINIASLKTGGGGWTPTGNGSAVSIFATDPELMMSILIRSDIKDRSSDIPNDNGEYIGYRLVDQYSLDDVSFVQELKEMRSNVDFGESSIPSGTEIKLYDDMLAYNKYDPQSSDNMIRYGNLYNISNYTHQIAVGLEPDPPIEYDVIQSLSNKSVVTLTLLLNNYNSYIEPNAKMPTDAIEYIIDTLDRIKRTDFENTVPTMDDPKVVQGYYHDEKFYSDKYHTVEIEPEVGLFYMDKTNDDTDQWKWIPYEYNVDTNTYSVLDDFVCWDLVDQTLHSYNTEVGILFSKTNVNGGLTIQMMPFVQNTLMNSSRFKDFVSSFTQVHKALEPVIMERLDGNNYLDCKLTATYGKPHTYCADVDVNKEGEDYFWPDLDIQIEFDVKLFNQALATNTLNELRMIVKSYFNRLTSIHTPVDLVSMDNNIYISHLIQQMEAHDNVAYMKFKGWYTDDKSKPGGGRYMDANIQAIVQKWRRLEDFPKYRETFVDENGTIRNGRLVSELEFFVPEMFVMDDNNIKINIIK
jgi:hypothetical protein